jgi:hypothetical protein
VPQPYERVTTAFAAKTGAHALGEDEATAVLRLAREVASASDDRRAAPLVCYLAGQTLAGEADPAARLARLQELAAALAPSDH